MVQAVGTRLCWQFSANTEINVSVDICLDSFQSVAHNMPEINLNTVHTFQECLISIDIFTFIIAI